MNQKVREENRMLKRQIEYARGKEDGMDCQMGISCEERMGTQ